MPNSKQATRRYGVAVGQVWKYGSPKVKRYRVLSLEQNAVAEAIVQREVDGVLTDDDKLRISCKRLRDIAERVGR